MHKYIYTYTYTIICTNVCAFRHNILLYLFRSFSFLFAFLSFIHLFTCTVCRFYFDYFSFIKIVVSLEFRMQLLRDFVFFRSAFLPHATYVNIVVVVVVFFFHLSLDTKCIIVTDQCVCVYVWVCLFHCVCLAFYATWCGGWVVSLPIVGCHQCM